MQSVSENQVTVLTPSFAEFAAPTLQAQVTLVLGTNQPQPTSVSLPNCFAFGSSASGTPTISAILPSSGTNEGHTRVTIVGAGFSTQGVQVFFGARRGVGRVGQLQPDRRPLAAGVRHRRQGNLNQTGPGHGQEHRLGRRLERRLLHVRSAGARSRRSRRDEVAATPPFPQVTIFGQGFQAPVAVTLAGIPANIVSVSATEIVVIPGAPQVTGCTDMSGPVQVVNINSGDGSGRSGPGFVYLVSPVQAGPQLGHAFERRRQRRVAAASR